SHIASLISSSVSLSLPASISFYFFFFFNATATTEIYTLSLHDALPIYQEIASLLRQHQDGGRAAAGGAGSGGGFSDPDHCRSGRSEEHTSELQSRGHLVCRLLLEKKKKKKSKKITKNKTKQDARTRRKS